MKLLHIVDRVHVPPGEGLSLKQLGVKSEGLCGAKVGAHNRILRNNWSAGKVSELDMERVCDDCKSVHEKERRGK